jgi:arylsulfatase
VVLAYGSRFGGWSLLLDHGRPRLVWARSTDPEEIRAVTATSALPKGASRLEMRFAVEKPGGPATVTLSSGGAELARLALPQSILVPAGTIETLDVGRDLGVPVTDYATPHGAIEGDIPHVTIDFD